MNSYISQMPAASVATRSFRQSMARLHTWVGLLPGWLLFLIFLFGTTSLFQQEISLWMRPELRGTTVTPVALDAALTFLKRQAPGAASWTITLPPARGGEPPHSRAAFPIVTIRSERSASRSPPLKPASLGGAAAAPPEAPNENAGERSVLRRFDHKDRRPLHLGGIPHRHQQHGLADTAKTVEDTGTRGAAHANAIQRDSVAVHSAPKTPDLG
ncbi:PepSY-associated TM helix domain-containing protein [Novosphingobium silvae]|nr:PepSY-associated TM helix domain-containing protein [Novosphingobium silvae]